MLRIRPECLPCTLSTGVRMAKLATQNPELQRLAVRELARRLSNITWDEAPIDLSYIAQRVIEEVTRVQDPYEEIKRKSNSAVLKHYADLKASVRSATDPLEAAVRLAIAGNLIDFGPYDKVDLEQPFRKASEDLVINDYEIFRRAVMKSSSLLYFLDNAGEAVFDRLLIETMIEVRGTPFEEVRLVVKEGPLVNDVTLKDAKEIGIDNIWNSSFMLIGDGSGSAPSFRSDEVKEWIKKHDLVIFKGQANFEIFKDEAGSFFLLIVKCPVIAEVLGVGVGDMILRCSGSR